MGTITKASYEAMAAECDEWHKRTMVAEARVQALEAAAKGVLAYYADERNDESWHPEFQALRDCFPAVPVEQSPSKGEQA